MPDPIPIGSEVRITSNKHPPHSFHRFAICTVIGPPDRDGDYPLENEHGTEQIVSEECFEPL